MQFSRKEKFCFLCFHVVSACPFQGGVGRTCPAEHLRLWPTADREHHVRRHKIALRMIPEGRGTVFILIVRCCPSLRDDSFDSLPLPANFGEGFAKLPFCPQTFLSFPFFSFPFIFFFDRSLCVRVKVMSSGRGRASKTGARNGKGNPRDEDGQSINKWAVATQAIELDSFHASEFWKSYKVRILSEIPFVNRCSM